MTTPRQHPRRRPGRPGLFVMGGLPPEPGQEDFPSRVVPATPETGELPVWRVETTPDATPEQLADAVQAAVAWDQETAKEPYQVDVTRDLDDTVRMGNSLSAAVRLELLADTMREQLLDRPRRDPVDGAELDPVDGLPVVDEDQAEELTSWGTVADLQAELAPLRFAAPRITDEDLVDESLPGPDVASVGMSAEAARSFGGAPARLHTWASRHDPRSREYGVRQRLRAPAPLVDRVWAHGPILDQGTAPPLSLHDASGCTGHAAVNAHNVLALEQHRLLLRAAPSFTRDGGADLLDGADAMRVYERAQELDTWPGEEYPGTSILAVMKAGQEAGLWGTYLWAFGTKDIAQALLQVGPVVVGIPWLSDMATPDALGRVTVSGEPQGGHALCLHGIRMAIGHRAGPWFGALQTYGEDVGDKGVIWIHHKDLATLLRSRGEAAIPVPELDQ